MGTTFLRAASVATLALLPILVAACGSYKGDGFLLGAFSSPPSSAPAVKSRLLVSTPGNGAVIGGIGNARIGRQMSTRERAIAADAELSGSGIWPVRGAGRLDLSGHERSPDRSCRGAHL